MLISGLFPPTSEDDGDLRGAIGSRLVARSTVKALRKDVIAKGYGGDITRRKKLIEERKEEKKRMKSVGNIEITQAAFPALAEVED